ncbi:hypothetical protein WJX79_010473 [Trebouxia sp. C0005]
MPKPFPLQPNRWWQLAPLIIENQLLIKGTYLIWETPKDGGNMVMSSTHGPDGFDLEEPQRVLVSEGYSSRQAGTQGKQRLPDKFHVARAGSRCPGGCDHDGLPHAAHDGLQAAGGQTPVLWPLPQGWGVWLGTTAASGEHIPDWGTVHEVVARVEMAGAGFERTMVLRLEPHCIIPNRTGTPVQIMHFSTGNKLQRLGGKATQVQPSRGQQPQRAPPGVKGVVANPQQDWTSCIDAPTGALGVAPPQPSETARPGEGVSAEEADQQASERSMATLLTGMGPSWELHGPRVARRLRHRSRQSGNGGEGPEAMEEVEAVILHFSLAVCNLDCMHLVLESVSPKGLYLQENRTAHPFQYR